MDVIIEYFKKFLKIVEAFLNALGITPDWDQIVDGTGEYVEPTTHKPWA
ncbi:MAG: hypothetical protein IJM45_05410 [Clostridia bacterium]|nr:hypothetical protein [Clostridia bacterium]MBQ9879856.1 hypothetical protein [Clostridia bacterium]